MNVTALARKLKITTSELFDALPLLGFDIGRRAIKINDITAQKIISNWPKYKKQLEMLKAEIEKKEEHDAIPTEKKKVKIPPAIIVKDFASLTGLSVSKILGELMKNGIFVSMNEKIDYDTAAIMGEDLNLEVILDESIINDNQGNENKLKNILAKEEKSTLKSRPPVIVVMGHVDHGKTKLLDAIREANVVDKEAGGITQHIGAYQVVRNDRLITFIDTPGHEVFTAMRSRGAKVADVAILVVAADDGVKPQTVEAFRIIEQTKIPFIVAINKIDKEDADIERTKNQLSSQLKIVPEDWGGKIMCVPVSAKEGTGIENILDSILLVAEMEQEKIVANPDAPAVGTVIESHIDRGEGPVATFLIQNGTLRTGQIICLEEQPLGKIRIMRDYLGKSISEAMPSTPVRLSGLKISPNIGDIIDVHSDGFGKKMRLGKIRKNSGRKEDGQIAEKENDEKLKKVNIIIKSDVLGSAEAIEEALTKLNNQEIKIRVAKKGLGNITEGDIDMALSSGAIVAGFNVGVPSAVEMLARDKKVDVKNYRIIYELVDDIRQKMEARLGMEVLKKELGKMKVLAVFKTENKSQIIGGKVTQGKILQNSKIEVLRGNKSIAKGKLAKLQAGRQDVSEVAGGQECGIQFEGDPIIEVGDILSVYQEEEKSKKL
ncbi:MAG: translation initiation factor IF-2 [Patescibacteria group bacterium]